MIIEKLIKSTVGYDGSQGALYDIIKNPIGHNIIRLSPTVAKARWATLCGAIEGVAGGLAFTAYCTHGVKYGPGDLSPILIGGGSVISGAIVLGASSCATSLRESSGFLADSSLKYVFDGALTGFLIGGLYTNTLLEFDAEAPLTSGVKFTIVSTLAGSVVGVAVTTIDAVFRYVASYFRRRD